MKEQFKERVKRVKTIRWDRELYEIKRSLEHWLKNISGDA